MWSFSLSLAVRASWLACISDFSVVIDSPEPVPAGIDGEAVTLRPPVDLLVRPAVLHVRISSRHPGASPSGLLTR